MGQTGSEQIFKPKLLAHSRNERRRRSVIDPLYILRGHADGPDVEVRKQCNKGCVGLWLDRWSGQSCHFLRRGNLGKTCLGMGQI